MKAHWRVHCSQGMSTSKKTNRSYFQLHFSSVRWANKVFIPSIPFPCPENKSIIQSSHIHYSSHRSISGTYRGTTLSVQKHHQFDLPSESTSSRSSNSTRGCVNYLSSERQGQRMAPTAHTPEGTGSRHSLLRLSALIMVWDAVNVRMKERTRLSFLTTGFSLYSPWWNRPQAVQGAAVNSFSLQWGQPTELKGTVRMLLQLRNSKHPWKETPWDGAGGTQPLSWDELLGLQGWLVLPSSG